MPQSNFPCSLVSGDIRPDLVGLFFVVIFPITNGEQIAITALKEIAQIALAISGIQISDPESIQGLARKLKIEATKNAL